MCGLAGVLLNGRPQSEQSAAWREIAACMGGALAHRGPDDAGVRLSADERCILASRRLAIQDPSPDGRMPLGNEDRTIWTSFNGEIYNFHELRADLEALGHAFRSQSDTEVLVHAYESWGVDFLDRLDGMFAIALYDERAGRLLLARDRFGEKPLYYAISAQGHLAFASEIKAILEVEGFGRRQIDPEALCQYLTFGFVMPPLTLFDGIRKLAPGEVMLVDRAMTARKASYWTPMSDPDEIARVRRRTPAEHVETIRSMLAGSVERRMVADVPVGAFLSGGVDSSTVVSLMSRASGRPIETVTVAHASFPDLDEWAHAERISSAVGARMHRVDISERDAIEALPDIAWHLDEPVSDPAALNTFFASKSLRAAGVVVALVGEGADEIFLGYGNYSRYGRLVRLQQYRERVPSLLLRAGTTVGQAALSALGAGIHRDLLGRALNGQPVFLGTEVFFQDSEKPAFLGAGVPSRCPSAAVAGRVQEAAPLALRGDPLALFSFSEVRMRMAEKLLMRVDKMASAHSTEVRAPFLDHRLVDYVLSIPSSVRTAGGVTKHLLKEAVAPLIPDEVIRRRKQGFSTPIAVWLRGEMGRYLEDRLRSSAIVRDGVLRSAPALDLLTVHRSGGRSAKAAHTRLWNLLSLILWYDRFGIDGVAPAGGGELERAA